MRSYEDVMCLYVAVDDGCGAQCSRASEQSKDEVGHAARRQPPRRAILSGRLAGGQQRYVSAAPQHLIKRGMPWHQQNGDTAGVAWNPSHAGPEKCYDEQTVPDLAQHA